MSIRKALFGAVAAGGVMVGAAGGVAADHGPYVHYEYPANMTAKGGKKSVDFPCGLFEREASQPNKLFPTCEAVEYADSNNQEFCAVSIPPQSAGRKARLKAFADVGAKALTHFSSAHKVCLARNAEREWQVAAQRATISSVKQNPGTDKVEAQQVFNDQLVRLMDQFNIPQNPSNPADLNYRKDPGNWPLGWTNCPIDRIAEMCKDKMGLER